jgi:hypothetical protein
MIADSVSKAASGGDLGVDDTRFEELMADIDDDEDDFLGGGEKVSKRVRPPSISPCPSDPLSHTQCRSCRWTDDRLVNTDPHQK